MNHKSLNNLSNIIFWLFCSCWQLEVSWPWCLEGWCLTSLNIYKYSPNKPPRDSPCLCVWPCSWQTRSESFSGLGIILRLLCWSRAFWWTSPCSLSFISVSRSITKNTLRRRERVDISQTLIRIISGDGQIFCPILNLLCALLYLVRILTIPKPW